MSTCNGRRRDSLTAAFSVKSAKRIRTVYPHRYTASNFVGLLAGLLRRLESATGKSPKKRRTKRDMFYTPTGSAPVRAGMKEEEKQEESGTHERFPERTRTPSLPENGRVGRG